MSGVQGHHPLVWSLGPAHSHTECELVEGSWEQFAAWATKEPARSSETMEGYKSLPKSEQGQAKRAEWIVGGPVVGGHRMASAVRERTVLTVDIDDCSPIALERLRAARGFPRGWEYAGHTTRSSTPEKPRVRLYFPLPEPLPADQYRLVALGLCEMLEEASIDDQGEQHIVTDRAASTDLARLMYGPTLCSNAPHVPIRASGTFPDLAVLAQAGAGAAEKARRPQEPSPAPIAAPRALDAADDRVDDYGIEAMRAAGAVIVQSPRRKSELTTNCPWHDDQSPSLDICQDGRMVCRAGCGWGGQPITWLRYVCEVLQIGEAEAFRFARRAAGLPERSSPAPAPTDPGFEDLTAADQPAKKAMFGFRPVSALRPVENLHEFRIWGEWITRTAVTIVTGSPGIGKSTLVRSLVAALSEGKDYLGIDGPGRPIKIAVLDYETASIFEHHQWRKALGEGAAFVDNILVADNPPLLTLGNLQPLLRELAEFEPDLVIVDTVSAAFALEDENSNTEMEGVIRIMRAIARTGPAVLAVAHPSKGGADIRGASALLGGLDTLLTYTFDGTRPDVVDETTEFLLTSRKNRIGAAGQVRVQQDGDEGFVSPDEQSEDVKSENQARVLEVLTEAKRPMKRSEIYEAMSRMRISRNSANQSMRTLARRGLIVPAGKASWAIAKTIRVRLEGRSGGGVSTNTPAYPTHFSELQ